MELPRERGLDELMARGRSSLSSSSAPDNAHRPRCRDLGIIIGAFAPGPLNSITDVPGVRVGHSTVWRGDGPLKVGHGPVRTGVTAILPHGRNTIAEPVEAACHVFNGAGTTTGLSLVEEYGLLETPICLTNTLSVGAVYDALARYVAAEFIAGAGGRSWFNPVVGETDDSFLSDIHGFHVREEHVREALATAGESPVAEGAVGAGTGTTTCGFKSGIGTSSRQVELDRRRFHVGVLVQSNFRGSLTVDGVPVGAKPGVPGAGAVRDGSIMAVIATDLPLDARQLKRLAARGVLGMARTGAAGSHSSGDYFIAFSTTFRRNQLDGEGSFFSAEHLKKDDFLNPAFTACAEAVEEAILNSIFKAVTVVGRDFNTAPGIDVEKTVSLLRKSGRLQY